MKRGESRIVRQIISFVHPRLLQIMINAAEFCRLTNNFPGIVEFKPYKAHFLSLAKNITEGLISKIFYSFILN